ncbi:DinI-like family protein [Escherichia coli]|nr:DinI-like family protein [Escherichia coli]
MRVEICIAKEKISKMPNVTRTADKDSAKTFVQETLKDTWESADEWFVH